MKDMTAIEATQGVAEEEDKAGEAGAEVEVTEEMTIKKTENWNHLEPAEVATEEKREVDVMTTMMNTRITKEDMGTEMTPDEEDKMKTEFMMNLVIENMI